MTEFDLFIDADGQDGSAALLAVSSEGVARGRAAIPIKQQAFSDLRVRVVSKENNVAIREQFGNQLFNAVFHDDILAAWSKASANPDGARLRLVIEAGPLAALPWELLNDGHNFLATDASLAVSRYIPVPEPPRVPVVDTLSVLLAIASPGGLPRIPTDEMDALAGAIGEVAKVTQVRHCTSKLLADAIAAADYHVVHYLGHGATGNLLLEGANPLDVDPLSDRAFAQLIFGRTSVRLAVLSACSSAQASDGGIFSGVGPALIRTRVPAVVAMQYEFVQLSTAQAFNQRFYKELADGIAVDVAVNRARNAISATGDLLARRDWSTPVLYLGTRNGRLIMLEHDQASEVEKAAVTVQKAVMQNAAAAEGWLALQETFESLRASHIRLAELTDLGDQLALLRTDFDAIVTTAGTGIGGTQYQSIKSDWNRMNSNVIARFKTAVDALDDTDAKTKIRSVLVGFGAIDAAIAKIAIGDLEKDIARLQQALAGADAEIARRIQTTVADLLSTSERTLGKLTPQR